MSKMKTTPLRLKGELGPMLKKERLAQGLTMEKVAEKAGISFGHISSIESGKYDAGSVSLVIWDRLCFGLGKDLNWLMKGSTVAPVAKPRAKA